MSETIFAASQPPTPACCEKFARIQAAHNAAFFEWLHAKSWRAGRKAAQKSNATHAAMQAHVCKPLPVVGGAEPAGERQPPADGAPEPSPAGTNAEPSHGANQK